MSDVPMGIRMEAARVLIAACSDLKAGNGMIRPRVVAAAYAEIQSLLNVLENHGVADLDYDGSDLMVLINAAKNRKRREEMNKDLHPMWPEAPENLAQRLLHVIDVFENQHDYMVVITATRNTYAPHGSKHCWTGLTLADLRALADIAVTQSSTMAEHVRSCDFTPTGHTATVGTCIRCGTPSQGYDGSACKKEIK